MGDDHGTAPVIFGLAGTALDPEEAAFFKDVNPAGFIFFSRNIENPDQMRALSDSLYALLERENLLILIDQEGGRVQRMGPPHWRRFPPMGLFADMAAREPVFAREALRATCRLIAADLIAVGINVDCLPLLDMPVAGADNIIGDRAFGSNAELVAELGAIVCHSLMEVGVLPVIKHIPGHGRALVDSHKALPRVTESLNLLSATDFQPFRALASAPLAMTAHIVYEAIDSAAPATLSRTVVQDIIRGHMNFQGLLMTDDLSMQALSGDFETRAKAALDAGCDILLHCNGDMAEMRAVAGVAVLRQSTKLGKRLHAMLGNCGHLGQAELAESEDIFARFMKQSVELG